MLGKAKRVAATAAIVLVGGCALGPVDKFSDRSVQYNLEAEQSQDRTLLLNIARASMRRPLEFTGLNTVSGTASLSGGAQLGLPFGPGPRTASDSVQLTSSVSGGPTFAVNVLDTQEFFEGILKPIELSFVDFYNQEHYSRTALLNLLISRIVIKQGDHVLELNNYAGDDKQLDAFQLMVDYLVSRGLTTKTADKKTPIGPLLTPDQARDVAAAARAVTAKLDIDAVDWCDLAKDDSERKQSLRLVKAEGDDTKLNIWCAAKDEYTKKKKEHPDTKDTSRFSCPDKKEDLHSASKDDKDFATCFLDLPASLYRVEKAEKQAKFCFEQVSTDNAPKAGGGLYTGPASCDGEKSKKPSGVKTKEADTGTKLEAFTLGREIGKALNAQQGDLYQEKINPFKHKEIDFSEPLTSLDLVPRSTEGVIYYLGEVVRRQLYPDRVPGNVVAKRVVMIKYGSPSQIDWQGTCHGGSVPDKTDRDKTDRDQCQPILAVSNVSSAHASIAVDYDGEHFALPEDNNPDTREKNVGRTYQILDIVTQLFATHKSAKDLPATSVFTVITPP